MNISLANHQSELYVASWLVTYDNRSYSSFKKNIIYFNEINPVWYNLNINYFSKWAKPFIEYAPHKKRIISMAKKNNVLIIPTLQNYGDTKFDASVIHRIINDPVLRSKHVKEIVRLIEKEKYDGIDIDYEDLPFEARDCYTKFIQELSGVLKKKNKVLSLTVSPKTNNDAKWRGPGAQDWEALVSYVDCLKIMVYDYHWITSHHGPVSPVDWLDDVLKYAASIPDAKQKIIIGLPLYGLDWGTNIPAKETMYQDAMEIMNSHSYFAFGRSNSVNHPTSTICMYSKNVELHFQYKLDGDLRTVYFQDSYSLEERLKVINQYRSRIKGITFWRLGGEDPSIWNVIEKFRH